jgi:hypothetical protein
MVNMLSYQDASQFSVSVIDVKVITVSRLAGDFLPLFLLVQREQEDPWTHERPDISCYSIFVWASYSHSCMAVSLLAFEVSPSHVSSFNVVL